MIATRLRQARLANGLTLDVAAAQITEQGVKLTRAALSNYELGKRQPESSILRAVARAMDVPTDYFLRVPETKIEWLAFRCTSALGKRRADEIRAQAQIAAEKTMTLLDRMPSADDVEFPERRQATTLSDADRTAAELRTQWGLGDAPVESLCQTAEDHGAVVVSFEGDSATTFDGVSGMINDCRPLLTVNTTMPADRVRFNLAHELGHVLMDSDDLPEKEGESLAHRFSSSLLVPPKVVKQELGERRRSLSLEEVGLLKQKYGLSMAAWIYAAWAHEIIGENCHRRLCMELSRRGWRKREPFAFESKEQPQRLRQLTLRALAENLIGAHEAENLCPGITEGMEEDMKETHEQRATVIRNLPDRQREQVLEKAAASAADAYENDEKLTDFEAFGKGDLYDEYP